MADGHLQVQQAVYQYPWQRCPRRRSLPSEGLLHAGTRMYNRKLSAFSGALPWCIPAHARSGFLDLPVLRGCGQAIHHMAACLHKSLLTHHHRSHGLQRYQLKAFYQDVSALLQESLSDRYQVRRPQRKGSDNHHR